jgi:thioredoxin:protein disulfide reductase
MKRGVVLAAAGVLLMVLAALPSVHPQIPSGREVVAPSAYVSREPVTRGSSFQIAVVAKIRPGFHINARKPSEEYLIPTDLRTELPAGFKSAGEIAYPKGELRTFAFSKTPLNVYEDKIVLRLPIAAQGDAPLGAQHIPLKLRYQACSNEVCLPPVTLDVDASLTVAASGTNSHSTHPELFSAH